MSNFYTDNPDILFNLENVDLVRITDMREVDYADADLFPHAPRDAQEAIENYKMTISLAGEISGEFVAPLAGQIDKEGHVCRNGDVDIHPLTRASMEEFRKADLMGINIPRRFGGLFMPNVVKVGIIEMIARADAGLMNIVGLQDIAETINEFSDEDIRREYLPSMCSGETTGAMVLTEPDAGSDLQRIMLMATPDPTDPDMWRLNGVKRFITNGCADVLLILARSEEGSQDGRGLSMFAAHKGPGIRIRRIEDKLGIHSSPTCEMQFTNVPATLIGKRKRGLTKYVMSLMNGARLAIAAQAIGIAEAAYREAREYAETRIQFNKKILDMPPVYEILVNMTVSIQAARTLIFKTAEIVDLLKAMEMYPDQYSSKEVKGCERLAGVVTPFCKYYVTEVANQVASDAISVLGGSGYMRDYPVERYFRDARITNIYEGTSQLQVVGALGGVLSGQLDAHFDAFVTAFSEKNTGDMLSAVTSGLEQYRICRDIIKTEKNQDFTDFYARNMVDIALDLYLATLLIETSLKSDRKKKVAQVFIEGMTRRIHTNAAAINSRSRLTIDHYSEII